MSWPEEHVDLCQGHIALKLRLFDNSLATLHFVCTKTTGATAMLRQFHLISSCFIFDNLMRGTGYFFVYIYKSVHQNLQLSLEHQIGNNCCASKDLVHIFHRGRTNSTDRKE